MKKTVSILFLICALIGAGWIWCAEHWRIGCLIAPFALVMVAVIACGIIESKEK